MINDFISKNTYAVVTGSSNGNGKSIVKLFKKYNINVIGVDRVKSQNFTDFVGDIYDENFAKNTFNFLKTKNIKSLILVNNAGITLPLKNYKKYPFDLWQETLDINLTAPFIWIEAFIPLFKKIKSGSIINITSLAAEQAFPDNPSYAASKGGLKMLTKFYANKLGKYSVRANNIGPGYIKTNMTKNSFNNKVMKKIITKHTILDKWGSSIDVAKGCLFLSSEMSDYITGQDLYIDGGWLAKGVINF